MPLFKDAVPEAEGTKVRTATWEASVYGRGNHDVGMQERESRRLHGRIGTGIDQTSRTIPLTYFIHTGRVGNKKPDIFMMGLAASKTI